jgi:radical SAM protein with 4Fe4S-binding SPASM domain
LRTISKLKTCQAPWRALLIKPSGDVVPDSQFQGVLGNINNNNLEEILRAKPLNKIKEIFFQGDSPKECSNCISKENAIGHSRRIFFDHKLTANVGKSLTPDEPSQIQYLELNLSNKCNLKCRMCNSVSSTAWIKEDNELNELSNFSLSRPPSPKVQKASIEKLLEIFDNPEMLKDLKYLSLRGGEPLLESDNIKILEKCVEIGIAKNIRLDVSTNGSFFSSQIFELFKYFKQIDYQISIEATGDLYKYIRGGEHFSIENLEVEIKKTRELKNINLIFAVTVSIYNIFHLSKLLDWFEKNRESGDQIIMTNTVVRPKYLNFQILPQYLKAQALKQLESSRVIEKIVAKGESLYGDSGKNTICESLQRDIFSTEEKTKLISNFILFNNSLDKIRQTNLLSVVPELKDLFQTEDLVGLINKTTVSL